MPRVHQSAANSPYGSPSEPYFGIGGQRCPDCGVVGGVQSTGFRLHRKRANLTSDALCTSCGATWVEVWRNPLVRRTESLDADACPRCLHKPTADESGQDEPQSWSGEIQEGTLVRCQDCGHTRVMEHVG